MQFQSKHIALLILLTFFVGISVSKWTGYWATESSKEPIKFETGEFEGQPNPADIRGSYTFEDVENAFHVPVDILQNAFMIPDSYDPRNFQNKMLEELYTFEEPVEIGNGSVKLFVSLYAGLPYTSEGDYLPMSAYDILMEEAKLDDKQIDQLQGYLVDLNNFETQDSDSISKEETSVDTNDTLEVKGKTLFRDVLDAGISQDAIEEILGLPMPNPVMEIRTFCLENEIEFTTVKTALQELIDEQ